MELTAPHPHAPGKAAAILDLLGQGAASTADVAGALGISSALASAHLSNLRERRKVTAREAGRLDRRGRPVALQWSLAEQTALALDTTRTVDALGDDELLRRAVLCAVRRGPRRSPPWAKAMDAFGLGSTYSAQLCRRFGIDPDTGEVCAAVFAASAGSCVACGTEAVRDERQLDLVEHIAASQTRGHRAPRRND